MFIHLTHWIINTDEISLVEVENVMNEENPDQDDTVLLISLKGRTDGIMVRGPEADYTLAALIAMDDCADVKEAAIKGEGW